MATLSRDLWREPVLSDRPSRSRATTGVRGQPKMPTASATLRPVLTLTATPGAGRRLSLSVWYSLLPRPRSGLVTESATAGLRLGSERFSDIREAMLEGVQKGVFCLQLHGAEHYWPPALVAAANKDDSVMRWLLTQGVPRTESLPSHLQSRWTDGSTLPSKPLSDAAVVEAVEDEVALFARVFGKAPIVAVPPTFVWDERVEQAWGKCGVRVVITPGCRYEVRHVGGMLRVPRQTIRNGDRAADPGAVYLVRDVYFEPSLGHKAEYVRDRILHRVRLGRPALVEMHRFNFVDNGQKASANLAELDRLLELTLRTLPDVQFLSPRELADAIVRQDPEVVETAYLGRLATWLIRLWEQRRLRWLAIMTLAVLPAALLWILASLATSRLHLRGTG